MPTSSSHILFSRLVDYVDNRLSDNQTAGLAEHLSHCPQCSEAERRLREVIQLMRTDKTESPPAHAMARVMSLLPQAEQAPSVIRRIVAALKIDTFGLSPAYGLRGDSASERQLLFEAGETRLHLQVSPAGDGWVISGQVLGPSSAGHVELKGESGSVRAGLDEHCEFVLPTVSGGTYGMLLRLNDFELEVPELKVGV